MTVEYFNSFSLGTFQRPSDILYELHRPGELPRFLSYALMSDKIAAAATWFDQIGVERGETILIFAQHSVGMLVSFFAAQMLGAIPSLMPPPTPRQDINAWRSAHLALLDRIQPKLVIAEPFSILHVRTLNARVVVSTTEVEQASVPPEQIQPRARLDDIAFLQHSSGTTGLKKGVMVTYRQLLAQIETYQAALGLDPTEAAIVSWLPIYHDMGLIAATLMPFVLGVKTKIIDTVGWLSHPSIFVDLLSQTPNAYAWMPNFAFAYLAQRGRVPTDPAALQGVKAVINCSEPCKPRSMDAFIDRYRVAGLAPEAVQVSYAMAEYVFAVTQTPPRSAMAHRYFTIAENDRGRKHATLAPVGCADARIIVSVGTPLSGVKVRIDQVENDGDIGEIIISGPSLCSGYFRNAALTAERFQDGEYRSGDIGFIFEGDLYITGRDDELLIVRGKNLYAHDLEEVVSSIDGVRPGRVVAFGINNEVVGSQDFVVAVETVSVGVPPGLESIIADRVAADFGVSPVAVILLSRNTLIKTTSGKISRSENAQRYSEGKLSVWKSA